MASLGSSDSDGEAFGERHFAARAAKRRGRHPGGDVGPHLPYAVPMAPLAAPLGPRRMTAPITAPPGQVRGRSGRGAAYQRGRRHTLMG